MVQGESMPVLHIIQDEGVTFGEVLRGIPHDVPAIFVYALVAAFVAMILIGNRRKPRA
jgi:hypothetical protein